MKYWLNFLMLIVVSTRIFADFFIPQKELEEKGLPYSIAYPINLSEKGDYLTFHHRIRDLVLVGKGFAHRVCLLDLNIKEEKLEKITGHDLPVFSFLNAFGNYIKREVMVLGNNGTKIIKVDFDENKVETVFAHEKNHSGFKSGPFLFHDRGEWYTTGWYYDKDQNWKGDCLVQIVLNPGRNATFHKKFSLENFYVRKDCYSKMFIHRYGDKIIFSLIKPSEKLTYLMLSRNGQETVIDKGHALGLFDTGRTRVYYAMQTNPKGPLQYFIKDFETNERWKIGEDNRGYVYPFISDDGKTIVLALLHLKDNQFDILYGKAKEEYKLKILWTNEFLGPIKLSNDGNVLALMLKDGIKIGFLK